MEQERRKIGKVSSVLCKFSKILFWLSIVLVAAEAAALLYISLKEESSCNAIMKIANLVCKTGDSLEQDATRGQFLVSTLTGLTHHIVCLAFAIGIYSKLTRIFANMKENGTPFVNANVKILKDIAVAIIIAIVISTAVTNSVGVELAKKYNAVFLTAFDNYVFAILGVLFFFAVAAIVQYGCKLESK